MIRTVIRNILKPFSFLPAILLMYMIFQFSSQPGEISSQLSYRVSHKIVVTVDRALHAGMEDWEVDLWISRIHGPVRKLAHMAEYFALAVAVSFPLYVYGIRGIRLMLLAGLICVGFSCSDEYHQAFVSGRSPSVRDVAIDSFGIFWGIIFVRIAGWTGRKTIFLPLSGKNRPARSRTSYNKKKEVPEEMYMPPVPPREPLSGQYPYPAPGYQPPVFDGHIPPAPGYMPPADDPDDPFRDWMDDYRSG